MHFIGTRTQLSPHVVDRVPNKKQLNVYSSRNFKEFIDVPQQNYIPIYIYIPTYTDFYTYICVCIEFSWNRSQIISRLRQRRTSFQYI